jgi:hypothetical protein
MKLIVLLLFLFTISHNSIAQTAFKQVDFVRRDNGQHQMRYECIYHFKDGMGRQDSIVVVIDSKLIDSVHMADSLILSMLDEAHYKAKYSLKEKTSYEVNHDERFMIYLATAYKTNVPQIDLMWYYIGQNAYGAKKSSTLFAFYDMQGKLVDYSFR